MYKNVKDTFPKQLIELIDMIEDENFRIVSDEISDGTITLQFYSPKGQDCYYDIDLSYFINQELPMIGVCWLVMSYHIAETMMYQNRLCCGLMNSVTEKMVHRMI